MNIITDWYYTIGSSHNVCEDYCVTGYYKQGDIHYGILSDGCSSQIDTDVGSRLLVKNFEYLLTDLRFQKDLIQNPSLTLKHFIGNARNKAAAFISPHSLDCTFLSFVIIDNYCHIFIIGDGCLFLQNNANDIEIIIIDYEYNAPIYLNYASSQKTLDLYKKQYGEWKCICTVYICTSKNVKNINKNINKKSDTILENDDILNIPYFYKKINVEDYKSIILCSDGAQSFLKGKGNQLINVEEIAKILLTLPKNLTIDFMKNHMRLVKKQCITEGWSHYDDFSVIAAVKI